MRDVLKVESDRLKEFAEKYREVKVQTSRKKIVNAQRVHQDREAKKLEKLEDYLIQEDMIHKEEVSLELTIGLHCKIVTEGHCSGIK